MDLRHLISCFHQTHFDLNSNSNLYSLSLVSNHQLQFLEVPSYLSSLKIPFLRSQTLRSAFLSFWQIQEDFAWVGFVVLKYLQLDTRHSYFQKNLRSHRQPCLRCTCHHNLRYNFHRLKYFVCIWLPDLEIGIDFVQSTNRHPQFRHQTLGLFSKETFDYCQQICDVPGLQMFGLVDAQ